MIIHINGWPGVGKKTIGGIVSHQLTVRFIHNHVLHDVAFACAGRGDADYWPLYEKVRAAAYEVLKRKSDGEIFVMTNALTEAPKEIEAWSRVVELAIDRKVALIPIVLNADIEELAKRVSSPERLETKLKDPSALRQMVQSYSLQVPSVPETQEFEVGRLSAIQAASDIVNYVKQVSADCNTASSKHLELN